MSASLAARPTAFLKRHRGIVLFIALMIVFRSSFADWNDVPSSSMNPTILVGDRIWVNKLAYDFKLPLTDIALLRLGEPAHGDIVVFKSAAADTRLVKRLVGLPGDVVELRGNRLVINGVEAVYKDARDDVGGISMREVTADSRRRTIRADRPSRVQNFGPVTVPPGHYLMLGDNRDNSADSRVYGFVPRRELVGRASTVVFSLDYDNWFKPRGDRFLHALQEAPGDAGNDS